MQTLMSHLLNTQRTKCVHSVLDVRVDVMPVEVHAWLGMQAEAGRRC